MSDEQQQIDKIIAKLNRVISTITGDVQKGLIIALSMVKADSMDRTPVDVGNLRASHYMVAGDGTTETEGKFEGDDSSQMANEHNIIVAEAQRNAAAAKIPFVEIGCTAFYAIYVHENLEAKHTTGQAKFMESAIRSKQSELVDIIRRFAQR